MSTRKPITVIDLCGAYNTITIVKKPDSTQSYHNFNCIDKNLKIFSSNDVSLILEGVDNNINVYGLKVVLVDDRGVGNIITTF